MEDINQEWNYGEDEYDIFDTIMGLPRLSLKMARFIVIVTVIVKKQ